MTLIDFAYLISALAHFGDCHTGSSAPVPKVNVVSRWANFPIVENSPRYRDGVRMDESSIDAELRMRVRREAITAIGHLSDLLHRCDPIEVISRVAVYILSGAPDVSEPDVPDKNDAHLEYLISMAVALTYPTDAQFPCPEDIEKALTLLTEIHAKTSACHILGETAREARHHSLSEIAASFHCDRMHVRGEAYWPHLRKTLWDLLNPHDARLYKTLGFKSEDYFRFMERMESLLNRRFDEERRKLVQPYVALMRPWRWYLTPGAKHSTDEDARFEDFLKRNAETVANAKKRFDEFGTPALFVITPETREEEAILAALSCSFGDNKLFHGTKPEHAFWPLTGSLTEQKPIILALRCFGWVNFRSVSMGFASICLRTLARMRSLIRNVSEAQIPTPMMLAYRRQGHYGGTVPP